MRFDWRKIPVLGRLLRIISAFLQAPSRFDVLFADSAYYKAQTDELRTQVDRMNSLLSGIEERLTRSDTQLKNVVQMEPEYMHRLEE